MDISIIIYIYWKNLNKFIYYNLMIIHYLKYIVILWIIIWIYIKLTSKFWSTQPIFHYYNIYYWIFFRGIIHKIIPAPDKFYRYDIKTHQKCITSEHIIFLKNNYTTDELFKYNPTIDTILPYFSKDNTIITEYRISNKLMGLITSRKIKFIYNNISYDAYYPDNLCIHPSLRRTNITPGIISSHMYNQRQIKDLAISISKREGKLSRQVPIISYYTYGFNLYNLNFSFCQKLNIAQLGINNIREITDIITNSKFKFKIMPIFSTFFELIKNNIVMVYAIIKKNEIKALWFIRPSDSYYKEKKMIECISSINLSLPINDFKLLSLKLLDSFKENIIKIENLSDNNLIISILQNNKTPLFLIRMEYYYYNFIQLPLKENEAFIIC